MENYMGKDLKF